MSAYKDRWIECTDTDLLVKGYYFAWVLAWATKRIPYSPIKSVERFDHDTLAREVPDLGVRRLQALGQLRSADAPGSPWGSSSTSAGTWSRSSPPTTRTRSSRHSGRMCPSGPPD